MSWSSYIKSPANKPDAERAIDEMHIQLTGNVDHDFPMIDQFHAAQKVAKELLKSVPGPRVMVNLNGHANGVGWRAKEGWSNDYISVTVTQVTDSPHPAT